MKRCLTVLSIVIIAINKVKGRNVSGISTHYFGSKFLMISMLHSHIERERDHACIITILTAVCRHILWTGLVCLEAMRTLLNHALHGMKKPFYCFSNIYTYRPKKINIRYFQHLR